MTQTPEQIAAAWASGLQGAGQKITDGVNAVKTAPGAAAARQKSVWVQNTTASQDKWARNTAAVTKEEWQSAMIEKGLQRIGQGATAAQPKFATFMGKLLPYIDRQVSSLPPRGNLEANINRMVAFTRGMSQFSKNG
jgi:hypothetical protein